MNVHGKSQVDKGGKKSPQSQSKSHRSHKRDQANVIVQQARVDPSQLSPRDIRTLQQTIGNLAVQRLLTGTRPLQRFVDPAVTAPLAVPAVAGPLAPPPPTRSQIINVYHANVRLDYLRVKDLIAKRPDLKSQANALRNAWDNFCNKTATTDGREMSPLYYGPALAVQSLNDLITAINNAENAVINTPLSVATADEAMIGTEFTFTKPSLHELKIGKDSSALAEAEILIGKWPLASGYQPVISKPSKATKSPKARMFTYQIGDLKRSWWWVLDVDDGCIETQTAPISMKDLNASGIIKHIIEKDIFSGAEKSGLAPDALVGGGHISLDRATTFGESGLSLRNFIVEYTNLAGQWQQLDKDFVNAPLIQELPIPHRQAFIQVIQDFDTAYNGPIHQKWSLDKLANELVTRVFTFGRTEEMRGVEEHYQATNLEHMQDQETDKRRLEMRRFPAQQSLNDLLYNHLQMLINVIIASRSNTLVPLQPIDTTTKINADSINDSEPIDVEKIKSAQKKLDKKQTPSQQEQRAYKNAYLLDSP